jgi:demethylmenaquinone methyltransferase/2-methoxy-6-polyprenyl-1,4-benzoquinol methylase
MPDIDAIQMSNTNTTDFGFEKISPLDKTNRVANVFSSVASNYDLMNDLMSFGAHRLWKRMAIHLAAVRSGQHVLDLAGGTGDLALLLHKRVGDEGLVFISDINSDMLKQGRNKLIDHGVVKGINYIQANAERLPFQNNSFDRISIAFGLRNVTDKNAALKSMYEKLRYGGCLIILEFSSVVIPQLKKLYDAYSFKVIPWLGKVIAKDEESYRYLVESIRKHPDQETLKEMLEQAGFSQIEYYNLSGGIVAIHTAYKT